MTPALVAEEAIEVRIGSRCEREFRGGKTKVTGWWQKMLEQDNTLASTYVGTYMRAHMHEFIRVTVRMRDGIVVAVE